MEIATQYFNKVVAFYDWFRARQIEIHKPELERFLAKENEVLLAILDQGLDIELALSDRNRNVDEVFCNILMSSDHQELELTPPNSESRARKATELVNRRLVLPIETQMKILSL